MQKQEFKTERMTTDMLIVGGGIAGRNWIDLAYGDDDFTAWHQDTTLYFLTPVPADMVWVLQ